MIPDLVLRPRTAILIRPPDAAPLVAALLPHFTQPTATRFVIRIATAILTTGRRTVANLLRTLGDLAPGHDASYTRDLSTARWPGFRLGGTLTRLPLNHFLPDGAVHLVGDDAVDGHPGRTVSGKGRHRDPARPSHSYTAWRSGHKWVVLAVRVKSPFATRRWALPVLIDLYRTPEVRRAEGRRHRTPAQVMCRLVRATLLQVPDRRFVFAGDSSSGTHEVTRFGHRHRERLTLVRKCHPDVTLFAPPPPDTGTGRPRVKGAACPNPAKRRRPRSGPASAWPGTAAAPASSEP